MMKIPSFTVLLASLSFFHVLNSCRDSISEGILAQCHHTIGSHQTIYKTLIPLSLSRLPKKIYLLRHRRLRGGRNGDSEDDDEQWAELRHQTDQAAEELIQEHKLQEQEIPDEQPPPEDEDDPFDEAV
jgi:hypothetical protein